MQELLTRLLSSHTNLSKNLGQRSLSVLIFVLVEEYGLSSQSHPHSIQGKS